MESKSRTKSWGDAQTAIAAIAMALMLGFWNLFSTPDKQAASTQADQATAPPVVNTPVATPPPTLMPGVKILLGGAAPQPPQIQAPAPQARQPKAVTNTRSSRP